MTDGNSALARTASSISGQTTRPQALERDVAHLQLAAQFRARGQVSGPAWAAGSAELLIDKLRNSLLTTRAAAATTTWARKRHRWQARILHMADRTGRANMEDLMAAVKANPNIKILTAARPWTCSPPTTATLLEFKYQLSRQCLGSHVLNEVSGQVETILADFTVLATEAAAGGFSCTPPTPVPPSARPQPWPRAPLPRS